MDVRKLPIWPDHRLAVPACVEVRRGNVNGQDTIIFWCPDRSRHVAATADILMGDAASAHVDAAVTNLFSPRGVP